RSDVCSSDLGAAGIGIIDGAALAHQVGQEEDIVAAQALLVNGGLLGVIVGGGHLEDVVHPPLVAGSRRKHAAHQVPAAIRMGKGVQAVGIVHAELFAADKDGAGGSQADVAAAVPDRA